jgi:hypothetical protein
MLSEELNFGNDDWEVALVSWQYFGQKFTSHFRLQSERLIEVQKCAVKKESLIWQWSNVDKLDITINTQSLCMPAADYVWSSFLNSFVETFNKLATNMQLECNVEIINDKIQMWRVKKEQKIQLSPKLAQILGIRNWIVQKSEIFVENENEKNFQLEITDPINRESVVKKVIQDVIIFPKNCIITGAGGNNSFTVAAGPWSLDSFCQMVQAKYSGSFYIGASEIQPDGDNYLVKCIGTHNSSGEMYFNEALREAIGLTKACNMGFNPGMFNNASENLMPHKRFFTVLPWLVDREIPLKQMYLKESTFSNIANLLDALTNLIKTEGTDNESVFSMHVNENDKVVISHGDTKAIRWRLNLSPQITRKLGFLQQRIAFGGSVAYQSLKIKASEYIAEQIYSEKNTQENVNLNSFWIFTDIVQHQHVGSKQLQLLRIVANSAAEGTFFIDNVDPYYLPVCKHKINSINIIVCSDAKQTCVYINNPVL